MTAALALVAAISALGALAVGLVLLRRTAGDEDSGSTAALTTVEPPRPELPNARDAAVTDAASPVLAAIPIDQPGSGVEAFELRTTDRGDSLAVLELLAEPPGGTETHGLPPWLSGAAVEVFRQLPDTAGHLRDAQGMRIAFSPHAMAALRSGEWRLMVRSNGSTMSSVVDATGKLREHGTLIRGISAASASALLLATVGASVAVIAQQQWLEQALRSIESKLGTVLERLQDTDHGRVEGAWVLADQIDGFLNERRIPSTLTTELAIARRDVDAVYFSRRRYLARITDRLGPELDEATGGNAPPKLSRAIKEALGGDAAVFESEAVLFLEASVVRARLTTTLAHVMSAGGDIADAMDLVEATRLSIYADLTEYGRTLRGLSRWEAGLFGELRGHDDFLDVLNKLATITDNELLPKLGEPAQPGYVELSRNADSTWTAGAA